MRRKKPLGKTGQSVRRSDELECPQCGCPNSPTARRCMYCREELKTRADTTRQVSAYIASYVRTYADALASSRLKTALAPALYAVMVFVLCATGVIFITRAVETGGFFNWSVGFLSVAYAGAMVGNGVKSIRKR